MHYWIKIAPRNPSFRSTKETRLEGNIFESQDGVPTPDREEAGLGWKNLHPTSWEKMNSNPWRGSLGSRSKKIFMILLHAALSIS